MSAMGELTFFLGSVRTATTPYQAPKPKSKRVQEGGLVISSALHGPGSLILMPKHYNGSSSISSSVVRVPTDLNLASFLRTHETVANPFTNVGDEPLGGSFHMSPPRSTLAPPIGKTSGGAEDLITLTALSFVVFTLMQKVNSLETELKDHKKLFKDVVGELVKKVKVIEVKLRTSKRKMVVSDSDQEEGGKQDVDLNALLAFANAVITVDSNISPGEDILSEQAAKRLHAEEQALVDTQRAELQRRRQQEVLASAIYYTKADWINIMAQAEANASLFKTLLGNDVSKDNFPARMAALIKRKKQALSCAVYSTGWSMARVKSFTDDQLKEEFEKIQKAKSNIQIQAISMTLKRTSPVLEEPSSKRQKSTEAPILSVPEVPQSPVVSSANSSGTRRKSLGRNRLTKPKSKLQELDLYADDQTFLKIVSDEDSKDEAPRLWSALVGWEVIPTLLGDINSLYRIDWSITYFTTLMEILYMVDRQDLVKFSYTMERQKSTEAPILSVPEVPQSPVVSLAKSSGTRRKSLGRNRLTKPKSKLQELDLYADDQTFLKIVFDEDSKDEAPRLWSALVGWEVIPTLLGDINALYRIDRGDLQVLFDYHEGDVSYPLSVKIMERMLKHKLEIDKDVMGNDMTTAEQLIRFIKNQLAAAQVSSA
nr:hypothetical protein [Tanacetum cinerariifolium]